MKCFTDHAFVRNMIIWEQLNDKWRSTTVSDDPITGQGIRIVLQIVKSWEAWHGHFIFLWYKNKINIFSGYSILGMGRGTIPRSKISQMWLCEKDYSYPKKVETHSQPCLVSQWWNSWYVMCCEDKLVGKWDEVCRGEQN